MHETDAEIVQRVKEGFIEDYAELVRRYEKQVYRIVYRLLGDPVESSDIAQEAFVRVYVKLDSFDETRPFMPWLATIAANLARNVQTSRWSKRQALNAEQAVDEKSYESIEAMDEIQSILSNLNKKQREVIVLRHIAQLSYREIAEALGESEPTIKSRLYEARSKIKTLRDREEANL